MRKFPIQILVLLSVFLSVCTDGDPTPTEVVAPSFLTALAQDGEDHTLFPLADLQELLDGLKPGRCALEYHHQGRKYKRKIHNLKFPKELRGSTDWRPFHYTVLLGDSLVLNRAVCMIPAGQEGIDAIMAQSLGTWPSTAAVSDRVPATGSDLFEPFIGRSPSGEDCEEGTEWFPEAEICWPPIEMEGILVSVNQEVCEDPAEFYDHFSQGCFCFFDCGDEFVPWSDWDSNWTPDEVCDRGADPDCGDGGGSGGNPPPGDPPPDPDGCEVAEDCQGTVTLTCQGTGGSSEVVRGETIDCFVEGTGGFLVAEWEFHGGGFTVSRTGGGEWSGPVAVGGTVTALGDPDGSSADTLSASFTVTPRNWTWDGSKTFATGQPGDLDNCMAGSADVGLTADVVGCYPGAGRGVLINPGANQGFTISPAGGPNTGLYFVTDPITRMDVRTQLAKKYRSDGEKYPVVGVSQVVQACQAAISNPVPPQNMHGINSTCFQVADFANLVSFTWAHEAQHLLLAGQEAQLPENDLYAAWEGIVESTSNAAFTLANGVQNEIHGRITDVTLDFHSGGTAPFEIWYGFGTWQLSTITVTF